MVGLGLQEYIPCFIKNIIIGSNQAELLRHYIIQIEMQLSSSLSQLFKRVENTILKLQSDEIIQQMRNDPSLYACKIKYIQQLIYEQMNSCQQLAHHISLVETLTQKLKERQYCIERMKNQYAVELQNIQHNCRQLIIDNEKKLREKDQYLVKYKQESQNALAKSETNIKNMKEQLNRCKTENSNLKEDRRELQKLKYDLQDRVSQLAREGQSKSKCTEQANRQISQLSRKLNQAEQLIMKMQNDMKLIKQSWQRRCMELQNMHQQELAYKAIEYQQKFKKELIECADTLKMGSSVVYSENAEVVNKKIELVQRNYKNQISNLAQQIKHFEQQLFEVKQQINEKEEIIRQLQSNISQRERELRQKNKELSESIRKKQKDVQDLSLQMNQLAKEAKLHKNQAQESQKQRRQLKQELKQLSKKHQSALNQCLQLQQQIQTLNKKILTQNMKIDECMSQICTSKEQIIQKEQLIGSSQSQIQKLKLTIQTLREVQSQQQETIENLNAKVKREKEKRRMLNGRLDKLSTVVRKVSKQSQILREEVSTTIQIMKNKLISQFSLLHNSIAQAVQSIIRKHKTQMSELLDELQEKQRQISQNIATERQQMKMDAKEYQQLVRNRQNQIHSLKGYISELQQVKKDMLLDLQSQKIMNIRLQQKVYANEQAYVDNVNKIQKDISRTMSNFSTHWSEQIARVQQQLQSKDSKIKQLHQKIDHLHGESQQSKKERTWIEDEVRKYKKKYQNLKQQRDQKIQSLLKKLQQEGKHRINLQKELKEVRMTVMKGTFQSNNNFSFNDKERQSNNKAFNTSIKQDQNRQRERQLSEIREMIAKTYKVVDGPAERDIGRNFSKKTLF